MRILLDEMIPRTLGRELVGHVVSTVQREGWAGPTNGTLLDAIDNLFDAFVTAANRHVRRTTYLPGGSPRVAVASSWKGAGRG